MDRLEIRMAYSISDEKKNLPVLVSSEYMHVHFSESLLMQKLDTSFIFFSFYNSFR